MDWLLERIASFGDRPALMEGRGVHTSRDLASSVTRWQRQLTDLGITPGAVVAVRGDSSPNVCSLMVALLVCRTIVVPLGPGTASERELEVAGAGHLFTFDPEGNWEHRGRASRAAAHPLLGQLRQAGDAGLVVFTSGSTGVRDSSSLWMRLGGDGVEYKIVDGILWRRGPSAMLGYLNAPAPFDSEGWFNTGDMVETNGEYIRILGRRGEVVDVGGAKVYPTKVESVLLELSNVKDVTVHGRRNPVTGAIVVVKVSLRGPEDPAVFRRRMREHCRSFLEPHEIPALVEFTEQPHYSPRFKKARSTS